MSLISDLTDSITGGSSGKARKDLESVMAQIEAISTPTAAQLQLDPLEQYKVAATLDPALAAAEQAGPSAFDSEKLSSLPFETMQRVLAQEDAISSADGMTPQERAAIASAESSMDRNVAGQRGAIAADFAQRGVPASLVAAALENGSVGQASQQGYENALNAEANAANEGISARAAEGQLAGQMFSQEAGQANTIAAAKNALEAFNANNRQQVGLANQGSVNTARGYNAQTSQGTADKNVSGSNERLYQNEVMAPQTAAQLALAKGSELAGMGQAEAGMEMAAGQQSAGLFSGLLGAGATLGAGAMAPGTTVNATGPIALHADGGMVDDPRAKIPPVNFVGGGSVGGNAPVPGDSIRNDTVPAMLSPGEVVVPRSKVARPDVQAFLSREGLMKPPAPSAHPSDISSILKALAMMRAPEAA